MAKVLGLPHLDFSILWVLYVLVGSAAGYAVFNRISGGLVFASLLGIFCLSMVQHCLHVLCGTSTSMKVEDFVIDLRKAAVLFTLGCVLCGSYIVYYRFFALFGIIAGFLLVIGYTKLHLEVLWSIGWGAGTITAAYIAAGMVTWGLALLLMGFGLASGIAIYAYRALTGDYDGADRLRILYRGVVAMLCLGLFVMAIGLFLF